MVGDGISYASRTDLVFVERYQGRGLSARRYITEILEEHVIPYAPFIGREFVLMHDNATPHTARPVDNYLQEVEVNRMEWSA